MEYIATLRAKQDVKSTLVPKSKKNGLNSMAIAKSKYNSVDKTIAIVIIFESVTNHKAIVATTQ